MKPFWIIGNIYAKILGWPFLAPLHHAMVNLSLHALGYGNMYFKNSTNERWFIENMIVPLKPKVVLDVGANVGHYSAMMMENTNATIYAIEPNPTTFEKLSELPDSVVKINAAISDRVGEATLHFSGEYDERASLDSKVRQGQGVRVKTKTVQSLIREFNLKEIDFMKVDTEGFEKEVFKGLGDVRPKVIQFEFNIYHLYRNTTLFELTELLPSYTFYRLVPHGWVKINPKKYLNNIFIFSNIVAVRTDVKNS